MMVEEHPILRQDPEQAGERSTVVGRIWLRRSFLVRFVLACLVATTAAVFLWPSRYDSTVTVMPQSSGSNPMLAGMLGKLDASDLGGAASAMLGSKSKNSLNIAILQSRTVQDQMIDRFGLQKEYRDRYRKDARIDLAGYTTLSDDIKSGVLTITVVDKDRYRAAAMAAEYVKELNRVSVENNDSSAHLERVFLERRLNEVNQDLKDSTAKLAQFSSKSMTFDTATQGKAMMEADAELQAKLIAAQAELSGLRKNFTDNNPRVLALQATVSELQTQLHRMGSGTTGESGQILPSLRELPLLSLTYQDLYRHAKIQEAIADLLTRQYEAAKVEEAKELPVVQVLDPPSVAEKRASPKRGTILVASLFFYVSLAVLIILLQAHWQRLESSNSKKLFVAELAGYWRQARSGSTTQKHHTS